MNPTASLAIAFIAAFLLTGNVANAQPSSLVLKPEAFKHYVDQFNKDD